MERKDRSGKFSEYLFMNDEKDRMLSCRKNPDEFVKYGKYAMRRRNKILVEKGLITGEDKWNNEACSSAGLLKVYLGTKPLLRGKYEKKKSPTS